jgi:uncharacterized protein (TIGR02246 family)
VRRAVGGGAAWLLKNGILVAAAIAVAPVTLVAVGAAGYAWWRGWTPGRLYRAAVWCLPMAAAWLVAVVVWPVHIIGHGGRPVVAADAAGAGGGTGPGGGYPPGVGPGAAWFRLVAAPFRAWAGMWQLAGHGQAGGAVVAVAPLAVPLGIAVGGVAWAYRLFRMRSGAGGLTPAAPAAFDQRQWRHQVRSARALIAAPGSLPLLSADGQVAVGATIRSVRHRAGPAMVIPYERLRSHQVVIGSTGTGKTTLHGRAGLCSPLVGPATSRRHVVGPPELGRIPTRADQGGADMTDRDEQAIRAVIDDAIDALNKGDAERLLQTLSMRPDAVHIGTDGDEWWTSQQLADGVTEQASSGIQYVLDDVGIHVAGDVGWAESHGHFSNEAGGTRPVRWTSVFVRENGGWNFVQSHASIGVPDEEIFG